MDNRATRTLKDFSRDELEEIAVRAMISLSARKREARALELFQFVILSFLAGAVVAGLAFLVGGSLGR